MSDPQLTSFVSQSRAVGKTDDQIREQLKTAGWSQTQIEEALTGKSSSVANSYVPMVVKPWGLFSNIIVSGLFGPVAGYLIMWRNLLRMGKTEEAKKFLPIGGVILLAVVAGVFYFSRYSSLLGSSAQSFIGNLISLLFPVWLYTKYQRQWQIEHPQGTKFSWSILGWGILGALILWIVFIVLALITPPPPSLIPYYL